jgi:hypothetical protein
MYGGENVALLFLPTALDGGEVSVSFPDRFTSGRKHPVPTGYETG